MSVSCGKLRIVSIFETREEAVAAAADRIATYAENAIAARNRFSWCLAGGKTPLPVYEVLAQEPYNLTFPWMQTSFFFTDERAVPATDAASNFLAVDETLFRHVEVEPSRIHRMPADREDADDAVLEYAAALHARLGPEGRVDLILLGMGADGHTASLFPESTILQEQDRWVMMSRSPHDHMTRMTLTLPILNRARHVLFFVLGREKAAMVRRVLRGKPEDMALPAARVTSLGGIVQWILDREAASELLES